MHCEWTVQQSLITTQCVSSPQSMLFPFSRSIQCSHSCLCGVPLVPPSQMTTDLLSVSIILSFLDISYTFSFDQFSVWFLSLNIMFSDSPMLLSRSVICYFLLYLFLCIPFFFRSLTDRHLYSPRCQHHQIMLV